MAHVLAVVLASSTPLSLRYLFALAPRGAVNDTERPPINTYSPPRQLTPAQFRIVAIIYRDDLLTYRAIAFATGIGQRTVRMHVEQIARLLPGDGNPLLRVALYAERLIESWPLSRAS